MSANSRTLAQAAIATFSSTRYHAVQRWLLRPRRCRPTRPAADSAMARCTTTTGASTTGEPRPPMPRCAMPAGARSRQGACTPAAPNFGAGTTRRCGPACGNSGYVACLRRSAAVSQTPSCSAAQPCGCASHRSTTQHAFAEIGVASSRRVMLPAMGPVPTSRSVKAWASCPPSTRVHAGHWSQPSVSRGVRASDCGQPPAPRGSRSPTRAAGRG